VHLLRYVVKCTVTDSPLNTQACCLKCPPSAWIPFLTRVTRELVTLRIALELNFKVVALTPGTLCIVMRGRLCNIIVLFSISFQLLRFFRVS
jgi:hypothetical protein